MLAPAAQVQAQLPAQAGGACDDDGVSAAPSICIDFPHQWHGNASTPPNASRSSRVTFLITSHDAQIRVTLSGVVPYDIGHSLPGGCHKSNPALAANQWRRVSLYLAY